MDTQKMETKIKKGEDNQVTLYVEIPATDQRIRFDGASAVALLKESSYRCSKILKNCTIRSNPNTPVSGEWVLEVFEPEIQESQEEGFVPAKKTKKTKAKRSSASGNS